MNQTWTKAEQLKDPFIVLNQVHPTNNVLAHAYEIVKARGDKSEGALERAVLYLQRNGDQALGQALRESYARDKTPGARVKRTVEEMALNAIRVSKA